MLFDLSSDYHSNSLAVGSQVVRYDLPMNITVEMMHMPFYDDERINFKRDPRTGMTVIVDGDEYIADQITKQLDKQIEVIKVKRLAPEEIIGRELLLVKVKVTPSQRREILDIVKVMNGQIIDISRETMTVELCSISSDIELITDLLSAYEVLEVARTGLVALEKGSMTI